MDSLTQLTFGAACGEAILGKKVGRKALIWGAVLGTLPDLDVFIPLGSPVDDFVYHRGFSHSLFLLTALSPVFAWLITKFHGNTKPLFNKWMLLTFVVLNGSVLLDLFTIYGTQIFWPIDTTPHAIPALFIIDPLFTLPILIGVSSALFLKNHRLNFIGLCLSLAYLIWALGISVFINGKMEDKLNEQGVPYSQFISSPAPFTTLLWRTWGIHNDQYFETYYSLFDGDAPLSVNFYPRNLSLMKGMEEHPPVTKLEKFTRGYFAMSENNGSIAMTDLRMGSEPNYVFQFQVGKMNNSQAEATSSQRLITKPDWKRLSWLWKRIWDPSTEL
jgi:inner membrane protein